MGDQRCESLRRQRTCTIAPERLTIAELRPDSAGGKGPGMFDPGECRDQQTNPQPQIGAPITLC